MNPRKKGLAKGVIPSNKAIINANPFFSDFNYTKNCKGNGCERILIPRSIWKTNGKLKNLVVLMKFADHTKRSLPSRDDFVILMNKEGEDPLAPTGSVRDVFLKSSYGKLSVESTVYKWITLPKTEAEYANGNSGSGYMLIEALHSALDQIDNDTSFSFKDFDADNDGKIDAITFIHSGYGAEWNGKDCYDQDSSNRIWSHHWRMPWNFHWYSSEHILVDEYHINPALWDVCGNKIGRIGVIAHEIGHFLGLKDLYDGIGGNGIGSYGLMGNPWGFDESQYYPPPMDPYSKSKLGWISPIVLNITGTYSIEASGLKDQVYRIDQGFPSNEYLLIENRQPIDFDKHLPQGGLAIWHIDETVPYHSEGYPGQDKWPCNGNHYHVALLQADGEYNLERGLGFGDSGDIWHAGAGAELRPSINPAIGPFPNTDSYQGGELLQTGIKIFNISNSGLVMTFSVSFSEGVSTNNLENSCSEVYSNAPSMPPTSKLTNPLSPEPQVLCYDNPQDWHDSDGPRHDCSWYSKRKKRCRKYGKSFKNLGYTASNACCVCGGGHIIEHNFS
eukprot:CAMPEP_0195511396 /NCGR_PEP_ID=MMETSP0794_2-20130614/3726_1 /TAXON_ID=515487 /ORGANISM="Stephanopyxis turris, Strain CCMP 815" /LENGTH=558 /DNA_ID=CAMNT_0040638981 /DNA_START=362 /DNA_END=2038 /DNA_ORIENTATION=+